MSTPTETVAPRRRWTRSRGLLLAGVTGLALLGGGAGLANAGQLGAPDPGSGYATVVNDQGSAVPIWPDRVDDDSRPSGAEDCPEGGSGSGDGGDGESVLPTQPAAPTTPDGGQL